MNKSVLWLWLSLSARIKREKQIMLLKSFGTIEGIYNAKLSDYTELEFLKPEEINLLTNITQRISLLKFQLPQLLQEEKVFRILMKFLILRQDEAKPYRRKKVQRVKE